MGYLMEEILLLNEGTRYDAKAAEILAQAPDVRDLDQAKFIIQQLFKSGDIPAFTHAKPWLEKYLIGVARMYKEENEKGKKLPDLINQTVHDFDVYLTWVKANRTTENATKLDNTFNNVWHLDDFKKFLYDLRSGQIEADAEKLKNQEYEETSNYELVPIHSYKELHELFGGTATGDGRRPEAADNTHGTGNTAWCHANRNELYNSHTSSGDLQMFVLAAKNWKEIPPEKTEGNPKDAYGLSLIAVITDRQAKEVLETTLRWNHVGVPNNADHQMDSWSELSKVAGFNVQEKAKELMPPVVESVKTVLHKLATGEGEDMSTYKFSHLHASEFNAQAEIGAGDIPCDVIFDNCDLYDANIQGYNFKRGITLLGGKYVGRGGYSGFNYCTLNEPIAIDVWFNWFDFQCSTLKDGEFTHCVFGSASFRNATLRGCVFDGCAFDEGCTFDSYALDETIVENCDFSASIFTLPSLFRLSVHTGSCMGNTFSTAVEKEIINMMSNPSDTRYNDLLEYIDEDAISRMQDFLDFNTFV